MRYTFSFAQLLLSFFLTLFYIVPDVAAAPPAGGGKIGRLQGVVYDSKDQSPLIGATVYVTQLNTGAITDVEGAFALDLPIGDYQIEVRYIGYTSQTYTVKAQDFNASTPLSFSLESEDTSLDEVTVVTKARRNTEIALINQTRNALTVSDGISAQQIKRSVDSDAGEVMKRIPGITLMNGRYVMVRGLNQRYNNVWMNGAAVPSSEPDNRVFSFDMVPSSQLDNMIIVKSPAPEFPADFSGGFVLVKTKDIPETNSFSINVKAGANTQSHFRPFLYHYGGGLDWLGMGRRYRQIGSIIPESLPEEPELLDQVAKSGFNNNWIPKKFSPIADLSLQTSLNRVFFLENGSKMGLLWALNYSNAFHHVDSMANNRFSLWNVREDQSEYLNKYVDNQYALKNRLGTMLNLSFTPNPNWMLSLKNNLNLVTTNRYTEREGFQNESGFSRQQKFEYYYNSRLIYTGQFQGAYTFDHATDHRLDWMAGYSYANNHRPDRRIINLAEEEAGARIGEMKFDTNDISREFASQQEHIGSFKVDYKHPFETNSDVFNSFIKTGIYGEAVGREFQNRQFIYIWSENPNLPSGFVYLNPLEALVPENFGYDKLFLVESPTFSRNNSYTGRNYKAAAYVAGNIDWRNWSFYAGARYELNKLRLQGRGSRKAQNYLDQMVYPSLNITYRLHKDHQLRLSYGMTVNRPEFRELSRAAYFDFDLFSFVIGNEDLRETFIQNVDLRYEWYPEPLDLVSVSLFYKHFRNPIEWSYSVSGGSYTYYYQNALKANNWGAEVEVRKDLAFMGLKDFSIKLNAAYINSLVQFSKEEKQVDRPMQGQSPYIINAGLFYNNSNLGLNAGIQYNRIGKRIVGVGRQGSAVGGSINNDFPDSYEMPMDMLDALVSWSFAKHWELKLTAQNLLNDFVKFKQFPKIDMDGKVEQREQTTKQFQVGQTIALSLSFTI